MSEVTPTSTAPITFPSPPPIVPRDQATTLSQLYAQRIPLTPQSYESDERAQLLSNLVVAVGKQLNRQSTETSFRTTLGNLLTFLSASRSLTPTQGGTTAQYDHDYDIRRITIHGGRPWGDCLINQAYVQTLDAARLHAQTSNASATSSSSTATTNAGSGIYLPDLCLSIESTVLPPANSQNSPSLYRACLVPIGIKSYINQEASSITPNSTDKEITALLKAAENDAAKKFRSGMSSAILYTLSCRAMGSDFMGISIVGTRFNRILAVDESTVVIDAAPADIPIPWQTRPQSTLPTRRSSARAMPPTVVSIADYISLDNSHYTRMPHDFFAERHSITRDLVETRLSGHALQTYFNVHNAAIVARGPTLLGGMIPKVEIDRTAPITAELLSLAERHAQAHPPPPADITAHSIPIETLDNFDDLVHHTGNKKLGPYINNKRKSQAQPVVDAVRQKDSTKKDDDDAAGGSGTGSKRSRRSRGGAGKGRRGGGSEGASKASGSGGQGASAGGPKDADSTALTADNLARLSSSANTSPGPVSIAFPDDAVFDQIDPDDSISQIGDNEYSEALDCLESLGVKIVLVPVSTMDKVIEEQLQAITHVESHKSRKVATPKVQTHSPTTSSKPPEARYVRASSRASSHESASFSRTSSFIAKVC